MRPLAEDHLRLVPWAYKRLRHRMPRVVEPEDVLAAGYLGLVIAAERYRVVPGADFAAYALTWIRGMMWEEVRAWVGREGQKPDWRSEPLPEVATWAVAADDHPALTAWDVERCLCHLSRHQRYLVEEIYLRERGVTEVAQELGLTMAVASKRCRYAVGKLQDLVRGGARTYAAVAA